MKRTERVQRRQRRYWLSLFGRVYACPGSPVPLGYTRGRAASLRFGGITQQLTEV